jgi:DNA polymerase
MQNEFSQEELDELIKEALSSDKNQLQPSSGLYMGLLDSDMLQILYSHLSNKLPDSQISSIFKDLRNDLLSRKFNSSIKDLHTVTLNCRKCQISGTTPELPKWNVTNPEVVFVADSPSLDQESVNFFLNSLKSAGFQSTSVCLTYVNRCPVRRKYSNQEVFNCSPYLHAEIQLLNPSLIVTLGSVPLVSMLSTDVKLKDYRGNIVWLGSWPILPTYSPIYAIKNGQSYQDQFISDIKSSFNFTHKESFQQ